MVPVKLYYGKPRLFYLQSYQLAMQCYSNAKRQHATAVQTYNIATGTVCTAVLSAHRVCIL